MIAGIAIDKPTCRLSINQQAANLAIGDGRKIGTTLTALATMFWVDIETVDQEILVNLGVTIIVLTIACFDMGANGRTTRKSATGLTHFGANAVLNTFFFHAVHHLANAGVHAFTVTTFRQAGGGVRFATRHANI